MINSKTFPIHAACSRISQSEVSVSPVRKTFNSIMTDLASRPLKPLGFQQHAGQTNRSLAQQVGSDTGLAI